MLGFSPTGSSALGASGIPAIAISLAGFAFHALPGGPALVPQPVSLDVSGVAIHGVLGGLTYQPGAVTVSASGLAFHATLGAAALMPQPR